MDIKVLIPTYKKTKLEIISLFKELNIHSDAVFANQCGVESDETIEIDNFKVRLICTDTVGVSKNRNILSKYADGDINICIDDDCPLVPNYKQIIIDFFKAHKDAECALFNGIWSTHDNRPIHKKKTKRVKKFIDVSYGGGPGFVFTRNFHKKYDLKYNELVGTPNYICAGEDSLFYYDTVKSKAIFYRLSEVLFNVAKDVDNSTYFTGINKQYVNTRGFILNVVHKRLFFLFALKHSIRFSFKSKQNILKLIKWLYEGKKMNLSEL